MKGFQSLGFAMMFFVSFAHAIPITATGDSGYRGDPVSAVLSDGSTSIGDLGATITVTFDTNYLAFDHAEVGTLMNGATLLVNDADAASGSIIASLASLIPVPDGEMGSLLKVFFTISDTAPFGTTDVNFQCLDDVPSVVCRGDYAIPLTTGYITVQQRTGSVPLPGTPWLLALGLPLLAGMRIRR